ncbi:hypothetical protein K505DRAFT_420379 [Melanomma pulvis-pyrius CBS 109.77]|uniref:RING-type domain-containing protein n=1 Tax=Melanomma pulvis-pyrius CBS 109.77 TaxID=1314802 RepID=A0A6A6X075_9PLEO|nr:hypothetical protein K505DRAFT_420379 [Melanomma pulvis-pyrius CBS 109.77]
MSLTTVWVPTRELFQALYLDEVTSSDHVDEYCAICYEGYDSTTHKAVKLSKAQGSCGHIFGEECILEWVGTRTGCSNPYSCPICRHDLIQDIYYEVPDYWWYPQVITSSDLVFMAGEMRDHVWELMKPARERIKIIKSIRFTPILGDGSLLTWKHKGWDVGIFNHCKLSIKKSTLLTWLPSYFPRDAFSDQQWESLTRIFHMIVVSYGGKIWEGEEAARGMNVEIRIHAVRLLRGVFEEWIPV